VTPDLFFSRRDARGRLRLSGRDRQTFLQGMVSNDVARLSPGEGCYAFLLDATGHVLSDARILCAPDYLLLDVEPGLASFVAETLERYLIMEKCRIEDATATLHMGQIFVGGPRAAAVLAEFGIAGAGAWVEGQNAVVDLAGYDGLVAATRLVPGPGFDFYIPAVGNADVVLLYQLELMGAVELDDATLDALRIEAGVPRFGVDMDAKTLAPETGQEARAINYKKGCYIGQEIVARIDARGHTNRTFTGFAFPSGAAVPASGAPVVGADGKEVGRVTSAALSPALSQPRALGTIRREHASPGTPVVIAGGPAMVAALPFVTPDGLDTVADA
jgi:folate-binding protein YgfZ